MRRGTLLRWTPICVLAAVIFLVSYLPEGSLGFRATHKIPGGDGLAHAVLYGILTWLLLRSMARRGRLAAAVVALAAAAALGGMIELTQPWAGRTCSWIDWLANLAGASLAVAFWLARAKLSPDYPSRPAEPAAGQDVASS